MPKKFKIAVLVGSLRKGSFNRMIAKAMIARAPADLDCEIVEIGDLPFYNTDLDGNPPAAWTAFREKIKNADGYLFVTPEFNRTVPAPLKNALDVGSRPYGQSAWAGGKPGAVVSGSMGGIGGFGANHHLRQSLVFLNILTLQQPEAYIGGIHEMFDDAGNVKNEGTSKFFADFMNTFGDWVRKIAG